MRPITAAAAIAVVVGVVVVLATLCDALAPITHSHLNKPDRQKWCGSPDYDCVVVKEHGAANKIKIDGIDLMKDTPGVLRRKLPSWFGPRPCKFVFEHRMLDESRPMAQSGVELMNTIVIYEANEHQREELEELEREAAEEAEEEAAAAAAERTAEAEEAQLKQ